MFALRLRQVWLCSADMKHGLLIIGLSGMLFCGCSAPPEPVAVNGLPENLPPVDNSREWLEAQAAFQSAYRQYGWTHPATAAALNRMALIHKQRGQSEAAEGLYRQAYDIITETLGENHRLAGLALNNLAELLREEQRYEEAENLFRRALSVLETSLGAAHPDAGRVARNFAYLYRDRGQWQHALMLYQRAARIARENDESGEKLALILQEQAFAERALGQSTAADTTLRQALSLLDDNTDAELRLGLLDSRALTLLEGGAVDEAASVAEQALELRLAKDGWDHPAAANEARLLGWIRRLQGEPEKAEELLRKALAIDEIFTGKRSLRVAETLLDLSAVLKDKGALFEQKAALERVVEIIPGESADGHGLLRQAMQDLAGLYFAERNYDQAETLLLQVIAGYEDGMTVGGEDYARALNNLGLIYSMQRRYIEAEPLFRRAAQLWLNTAGSRDIEVANVWLNLADLFDRRRMPEEAALYRLKAERLLKKKSINQ